MDVAYNHNLIKTSLSKADFITYIKSFSKKLKAWLETNGKNDRVASFQLGANEFAKKIASDFENYEFYTGSSDSDNLDGSIVATYWEDEGLTGPVFYFFKDALKEVKC